MPDTNALDLQMTKCKSCQANIFFARNVHSGKAVPLDRVPLNHVYHVWPMPGSRADAAPALVYQSHFLTCPNASSHSKKKG